MAITCCEMINAKPEIRSKELTVNLGYPIDSTNHWRDFKKGTGVTCVQYIKEHLNKTKQK